MRPIGARITTLLLAAALAGCAGARRPAARAATSAADPAAPVAATPAADPATPAAAAPAADPATTGGPCSPGSSAMDLTTRLEGGITSKPPLAEHNAAQPWLLYLSAGSVPGGARLGTIYAVRSGTATVPTEALTLRGELSPAPTADWFASHLSIEGITPNGQIQIDSGGFELRLPAGQAGEAFRFTLRDVLPSGGTAGDVSINFCRSAAPTATLLYQSGDGWRPAPTQIKTTDPLTLRVAFSAAVDRPSAEDALRQRLVEWHNNDGPLPRTARAIGSLTWEDDRTVTLTLPQPPSVVALSARGARATSGLFVTGGFPYIYMGQPAYLEAVNPATGQGRRLLELPSEVQGAQASPDGRWLYLTVVQMLGGEENQPRWQHLVYDLSTGKSHELAQGAWIQTWQTGGKLVSPGLDAQHHLVLTRTDAAGKQQQTVLDNLPAFEDYVLSPDASQVALLVHIDPDPAPYPWQSYRLVIAGTDGKTQQSLPEVVRLSRPGKDGIRLYDPVWSPDGSRLAFTQDTAAGVAVMLADVAAGHVRTLAGGVKELRGSNLDPVSWSPDGRRLLVGPVLLSTETGREQWRLAGPVGEARWSPDGAWVAEQSGEWTAVRAVSVATGQTMPLGEGLLVGFTADGQAQVIRWARAKDRAFFSI